MNNVNDLISCCGSDCSTCYCFGNMCKGCNAVCGKVFHAPEGKECPIYYCCKIENGYESCGECDKLPCDLILILTGPLVEAHYHRHKERHFLGICCLF